MLNRLARDQVAQMMARVAGGKRPPSAVVHRIVTQTDGVPLFIEELTKAILESGLLRETDGHYELTGPLSAVAIPTTLQDSLMARLDRLGMARASRNGGRRWDGSFLMPYSRPSRNARSDIATGIRTPDRG